MNQIDNPHSTDADITATKCPHMGQEYRPLDGPLLHDPYPFLARAREEEPLFFSSVLNAWVVTRYSDVITILKQPAVFSSKDTMRPIVTYSARVREILQEHPTGTRMVNSDGEAHKRYRAAASPSFTKERIDALEPFIRQTVNRLIDQFVADGQTDIIASLAYPTPLLVILRLLGIPEEDMEQCKQWSDDFLILISSQVAEEQQISYARSHSAFCAYLESLIQDRQAAPQADIISDLVMAQEYHLTVNEIVNTLHSLIIAGHVTTTDLLGNGLRILLEQPSRWQALCEQPASIPWVIEEILRYDSPVHGFFRTALQDVCVGDVDLPKDTSLFLVFGSANRDETQFPAAEHFDVTHFTPPMRPLHLAFGHGLHVCLGSVLARLEARIVLQTLAERLPGLCLVPDQRLLHKRTLLNRGYQKLYVQWSV